MIPAPIRIAPIRDHIRRDELVPPPFITPIQMVRPNDQSLVKGFPELPK